MSKIEELIQKLCPNGVEYRKLGDICEIRTGKLNANAKVENGLYPFFTCDALPFRINTYSFDTEAILVSGNGSQVGHINYYKGKFDAYQRTYILSNFNYVDIKFLLHFLKAYLKEYIMLNSNKGSVPYITLPMLQDYLIPVPPIEVQEEIVRILDKFSTLSEKLNRELELRKEQYEYYRGKMLSFEGKDVEWKLIGDLFNILRGKRLTKKLLVDNGKYPVFHGGIEPLGYYTEKNRESNTVMVVNVGASAGTVGFCPFEFWSSDGCFCLSKNKDIMNKFAFYCLKEKEKTITAKVRKAGIPTLDAKAVYEIKIPIPSLAEQERIVSILDKFDTLVNDQEKGLPAEIRKVQQQYEYYRDKLLTF